MKVNEHISVVLALEILERLKGSGATQLEALTALDAARALIHTYMQDVTMVDAEAMAKAVGSPDSC